jgi:hypothetical protein
MKLDFITPNASTLGWIDSYMQFHDDIRVQSAAEKTANQHYDPSCDGWEEQPERNIRSAFYAFMAIKESFGITDNDINNQ